MGGETRASGTGEHFDPVAMAMALRVAAGAIKPKARERVYELLVGMARQLQPPVDLNVIRLHGYRPNGSPRAHAIGSALVEIADNVFG